MARGSLTLLEVPADMRSRRAAKLRQQIWDRLADPAITNEQRAIYQGKLQEIGAWERGTPKV